MHCLMKATVWKSFDRIGMTLSMACAIHCLAMPLLLPLIPLLAGSFWVGETTELVIVIITLLIAVPTLLRGYLKHRKLTVPAMLALGLLLLALRPGAFHYGHAHGHWHGHQEELLHFVFAALAGFSLAIGHWVNLKLCKSCPSCKEEDSIRYCD